MLPIHNLHVEPFCAFLVLIFTFFRVSFWKWPGIKHCRYLPRLPTAGMRGSVGQ
jgi:hypothetical protein